MLYENTVKLILTMEVLQAQKKKHFELLLEQDHVLLHLDSRKSGVTVPKNLANNPALSLKVSRLFQGEMTFDNKSIVAYLRFNGEYFRCEIPWESIWGMSSASAEQKIWQQDSPKELVIELAKQKFIQLKERIFKKSPDAGKDKKRELKRIK